MWQSSTELNRFSQPDSPSSAPLAYIQHTELETPPRGSWSWKDAGSPQQSGWVNFAGQPLGKGSELLAEDAWATGYMTLLLAPFGQPALVAGAGAAVLKVVPKRGSRMQTDTHQPVEAPSIPSHHTKPHTPPTHLSRGCMHLQERRSLTCVCRRRTLRQDCRRLPSLSSAGS
jgi:hypothetical protein